jgi:hypothetical protein
MPWRNYLATLFALLLAVDVACTKDPPPAAPHESVPLPSDRAASPSPAGTSQNVLQKTFNLKSSATFPFEIPAHAVQPHLHGIFTSFVGQLHGPSDASANISFLVLNEQQNNDYASGGVSDTLFSVEASHNQSVNFDLPPSMSQPVKYYLVFRSPDSKTAKVIEASFRVDF